MILGNSSLTGGSAGGGRADIGRVGPTVDVLPSTETGNPIDDIVHPQLKDKTRMRGQNHMVKFRKNCSYIYGDSLRRKEILLMILSIHN